MNLKFSLITILSLANILNSDDCWSGNWDPLSYDAYADEDTRHRMDRSTPYAQFLYACHESNLDEMQTLFMKYPDKIYINKTVIAEGMESEEKLTALNLIIKSQATTIKKEKALHWLLKKGANITLNHLAESIYHREDKIFDLLATKQPHLINELSAYQKQCLTCVAIFKNNQKLIDRFLPEIDTNCDLRHISPLLAACASEYADNEDWIFNMINRLKKQGFDIKKLFISQRGQEWSALEYSVCLKKENAIKALLRHKVTTDLKQAEERCVRLKNNPYDSFRRYYSPRIHDLLKAAIAKAARNSLRK